MTDKTKHDEGRRRQEESEDFVVDILRQFNPRWSRADLWPPLNPDPACERCGGTGYSVSRDEDGPVSSGRCQCNTEPHTTQQ